MIFDLIRDFANVLDALPVNHPQFRILALLNEALRRDVHFIDRHRGDYPQALFQCLWNSCWWYDSQEAARQYSATVAEWVASGPRLRAEPHLDQLLEEWEYCKAKNTPAFTWIESLRPPVVPLGAGQHAVLPGHADEVRSLKFSGDARQLASLSKDGTLSLWDTRSSGTIRVICGDYSAIEQSQDDTRVVCVAKDGMRHAWDFATGAEIESTNIRVKGGAYSPDGTRVISSTDGVMRIQDAFTGEVIASMRDEMGLVTNMCYSPDGTRIITTSSVSDASGRQHHALRVWSADEGILLSTFRETSPVESVSFSPNGERLLVVGFFGRGAYVVDAATGQKLMCLRRDDFEMVLACYSPDGERILTVARGRSTIREWDAYTGLELRDFRGHEDRVTCLCYSSDGAWFASGSQDRTVRVWSTATCQPPMRLRGHNSALSAFRYSPDGAAIVSGSGSLTDPDDVSVRIWNAANGEELATLRGYTGEVREFCFSPDGTRIYSCAASFRESEDDSVRVWNATTGECLADLRGHKRWVVTLCVSPDGQQIASGSFDRTIRIWDPVAGTETAVLAGHQGLVMCVRYSTDGCQILSGSADQTVMVWDARNFLPISVLRGHTEAVRCVCYSPNATRIASGSEDCTIRVWDAASNSEIMVLRGHTRPIAEIAFSPDGRLLASSSFDRTIRVWDVENGDCRESHDGWGDVAAIAAGSQQFPWRVLSRGMETVVEDAKTGHPVAWLSETPNKLRMHPSGASWAGRIENHLRLFELQGVDLSVAAHE